MNATRLEFSISRVNHVVEARVRFSMPILVKYVIDATMKLGDCTLQRAEFIRKRVRSLDEVIWRPVNGGVKMHQLDGVKVHH